MGTRITLTASDQAEEAAAGRRLGASDDLVIVHDGLLIPRLPGWSSILRLALGGERLDSGEIAGCGSGHELVTVVLEQFLHTLDRIAVIVEQVPDALEKFDVVGPIVPAPSAALERFDLRKPGLPEPQDVLRQIEVIGDFADGPERVGTFFHRASGLRLGLAG